MVLLGCAHQEAPTGMTGVAVRAGLTLIESSILGAITTLAVIIAAWAVWKLSKVQDARVRDLERCSERMEGLAERMAGTLREASSTCTTAPE